MPLAKEQSNYIDAKGTTFVPSLAVNNNLGVLGTALFNDSVTINKNLFVSGNIIGPSLSFSTTPIISGNSIQRMYIDSSGNIGINSTSPSTLGAAGSVASQLGIVLTTPTTVGLVVRGAISQTSNLQEWQGSNGASSAYVNSSGFISSSTFYTAGINGYNSGGNNSIYADTVSGTINIGNNVVGGVINIGANVSSKTINLAGLGLSGTTTQLISTAASAVNSATTNAISIITGNATGTTSNGGGISLTGGNGTLTGGTITLTSGNATFNGAVLTISGGTTSVPGGISLVAGSGSSAGSLTLDSGGGSSATINIGTTNAAFINIGSASVAASKTINIGTNATSATTAITIGSSSGATSTVTLNGKTTAYPVAPSGTTSGTVTQSAQLSGYIGMPQNAQATSGTFAYTFAASDAGKHIYATGSPTSATFTIPANSAVAFEIGTTFIVMNDLGAATNISIAITTDTMQLAGTGTTGTRTLARYGVASITKVTATKWIISGNGLT